VDGEELRRTGKSFHLLEINRGSVFCVCLLSDFVNSLVALVERHHPHIILLEATGLADPIAIGELLNAEELSSRVHLLHVCCIIDAVNFLKMKDYMIRILNQVRVADHVIINKCDLNTHAMAQIESAVRDINPFAHISQTSYCQVPLDKDFLFQMPAWSFQAVSPQSCGRLDIGSAVVRTLKKIKRDYLVSFLEENKTQFIRLKGFVVLTDGSTVAVQSSFGQTAVYEIENYSGATELIAMGPELNAQEFTRKFHAAL
jgi:G3E family GTPase